MGNKNSKYCPICFKKLFIRSELGTTLNQHIHKNGFKKDEYLYKAEELLLFANAPFEILMEARRAVNRGFVSKKCAVQKTLQAIGADKLCFSCGYQETEERAYRGQRKIFFFSQIFNKSKQRSL